MALAGRSGRRGAAGRRWLLAGVVLTLLVLLINASVSSRSRDPARQMAEGAWIDRVLPIVASSSAEGQELQSMWSSPSRTTSALAARELRQVSAGASKDYREVSALHPPPSLAGPAGLLDACLLVRAQATSALERAVVDALSAGGGLSGSSSRAIAKAGEDLQVSDRAYELFVEQLSHLGVHPPPSVWVGDPSAYQASSMGTWLATVAATGSLAPVHRLQILAVSTTPSAVGRQSNGTELLPPATSMDVTIVVADTGNQPESNLTVTASISPAAGASSVRDFMDLTPGQSRSIDIGPLDPPQGTPFTLTVVVTPPAGSPTPPATESIVLAMPSISPPTTTAPGH